MVAERVVRTRRVVSEHPLLGIGGALLTIRYYVTVIVAIIPAV